MDTYIDKQVTIHFEDVLKLPYDSVSRIYECNFGVDSRETHEQVMKKLDHIPISFTLFENLLTWLIERMRSFNGFNDSHFSLVITDSVISLVAGLAQKEDSIYKKLTNLPNFNKLEFTKLIEKLLNNHPYFTSRGACFILLAASHQPNLTAIINALNILLDENLVETYCLKAIPHIHSSANDFTEKLLKSLSSESAVKIYELLKIITNFAMDNKIDAKTKSKILHFLMKESASLSAKKSINYYYTEVRIPFTTTLEKEYYKAWIKIQGLSGKAAHSDDI